MCTDTRREIGRRLTDGMPVTADDTDKLLSNELTSVTTNDTSIQHTNTNTGELQSDDIATRNHCNVVVMSQSPTIKHTRF